MAGHPLRALLPVATALLVAGFVVGLVVYGRVEGPEPTTAAPAGIAADVQQPVAPVAGSSAAAAATASGALPDLSTIAERALGVSVNISSTNLVPLDPFFQFWGGNRVEARQSLGSGVIVSSDGYILTNTHVIGNQSQSIRVTLDDGRELPATLIGTDAVSDLAVIKVDETGLPTLPWGDSSQLRVAEWVLAIGNPFQLSRTVTLGIVSTVQRSGDQVGTVQDFIQTDAAINPGNSGGALINARGELVGINTMIYSETGGYQGIGFAIPSNVAREIMNELIQHGAVSWGSIGGIDLVTVDRPTAARYRLPVTGVFVRDLYRDTPAHRAGLQPRDIITAVNGQPAVDADQLLRTIIRQKIGSTVTLTVVKPDGREVEMRVPVVARQAQRQR